MKIQHTHYCSDCETSFPSSSLTSGNSDPALNGRCPCGSGRVSKIESPDPGNRVADFQVEVEYYKTAAKTAIKEASAYCYSRYKGRDPLGLRHPAVFTSHEYQKIEEAINRAIERETTCSMKGVVRATKFVCELNTSAPTTPSEVLREFSLKHWLNKSGQLRFNLVAINHWLDQRSDEELSVIAGGEYTEMMAALKGSPEGTHELLNDYFEGML